MTEPARPATRPRWLLALLIAFTAVCAVLLLPAGMMALTSPMLSDSGVNAAVWILMLGGTFAPVVFLLSPVVAWVGYGTGRYRLARLAMCGPLVWFAYMAAAFGLVNLAPPHP